MLAHSHSVSFLLQGAANPILPVRTGVFILASLIKMVVIFTIYMVGIAYSTFAERRVSAWIQDRHGPNRVGPWGLFQVLADGIKNIMKEETYPDEANTPIFILAPALAFIPAMITWAVIPFAAPWGSPWGRIDMVVADLPVGFLFTLAIASLGVYGLTLAGWASNNKYALLGGLRASAQMISYEIAMGMATVCVLIVSGNAHLTDIIQQQSVHTSWNVAVLSVACFIFMVAAFAETNRVPFDLPEAEAELIAGYHTEYSAMKFSMFPISEYANMITAGAMTVTLFFGGWDIPFTHWDNVPPFTILKVLATFGMFAFKVLFTMFFFIWIRWTLPRFRYDQLMSLGWKFMLPASLAYVAIVASVVLGLSASGINQGSWAFLGIMAAMNLVLVILLFFVLDRGRIISPAYSRLDKRQVNKLKAVVPALSDLSGKGV